MLFAYSEGSGSVVRCRGGDEPARNEFLVRTAKGHFICAGLRRPWKSSLCGHATWPALTCSGRRNRPGDMQARFETRRRSSDRGPEGRNVIELDFRHAAEEMPPRSDCLWPSAVLRFDLQAKNDIRLSGRGRHASTFAGCVPTSRVAGVPMRGVIVTVDPLRRSTTSSRDLRAWQRYQ